MKVYASLAYAAFLALTVTATPLETHSADDFSRVNREGGWYVLLKNETVTWISVEEGERLVREYEEKELIENPENHVDFYLYTKSNTQEAQKITGDSSSISQSNFNISNPTRLIIHDWTLNYTDDVLRAIRDAWLSRGAHNVILVDWARGRDENYASSLAAAPGAGQKIAKFVDYLVKRFGLSLDDTETVGFGLGAHVAGFVGKQLLSGKLRAIVGLNPSVSLLRYEETNKRLHSNDAQYVESIHTDVALMGSIRAIGRVAFYPNGGFAQPGCEADALSLCNHKKSCIYYAEAVRLNDFAAIRCKSYEDAVYASCGNKYSNVRMGDGEHYKRNDGYYYVPVHNTSPYGYRSWNYLFRLFFNQLLSFF